MDDDIIQLHYYKFFLFIHEGGIGDDNLPNNIIADTKHSAPNLRTRNSLSCYLLT